VRAVHEMLNQMDRGDIAVVDCTGLRQALHDGVGDGDDSFDAMDTQQDAMQMLTFLWNEIGCQSMFAFVTTDTTTLLAPTGQTRTTVREVQEWVLGTYQPLPADIELGIHNCFTGLDQLSDYPVRCDADGCFTEDGHGTCSTVCTSDQLQWYIDAPNQYTAPQVLFLYVPRAMLETS
jgi:hypothetical protein